MQETKRCGFNPWVRKIPWRRHGNPLQYSCLGDSMDRGAWWATVHRVTKGQTRLKRLHKHTHTHSKYCLKRIFCGSLEFLCVSLGMPFRPFLKTEFTWATSRDKSMSHQDTGLFTVAIKAKDLLSSVFLSCKANPIARAPSIRVHCDSCVEFRGKGNPCDHAKAQPPSCAMSNKVCCLRSPISSTTVETKTTYSL